MINSRREIAVDIVLEVSGNSHGNVCSEDLIKVVAYEHGLSSGLKFSPDFQNREKLSRGVLQK